MSKDVSMSIVITRIGELYEATVSPPHSSEGSWSSPRPMAADLLIEALRERGCHQTDIGDAFYAADPEWLAR